jgi:aminoglycoside 6'-N-acetyltransferase I
MSEAAQRIVRAAAIHMERWAQMRAALWPETSVAGHQDEITDMLQAGESLIAFVALDEQGGAIAFVEAALRHDYVNGCDTSPVLFVEGLYVAPDARRAGLARALIDAVTAWGQEQGCTEMASDAEIANLSSHAFHQAAGFAETERVVYFRKMIS